MLPPLRSLIAFEAVARLGSIGAASRELFVTQAAVSQQLKLLEGVVGCALFERSQKGVALTAAAQQYLPVVAGSLQHLKLQTEILFGEPQADILRIKVNHSFGHRWLLPRLRDFTERYGFIRLDLSLVDWPSRQPCTDADIEITNGFVETENTQSERLFHEQWLMVCSPGYRGHHREALDKGHLAELPAVQVKGYEESWMHWLSHNRFQPRQPNVQLAVSNSLHALEAARQGIGLLLVRSLVARPMLDSGELVIAVEGSMPSESGHYLITPKKGSPKISFFCDWLRQQCGLAEGVFQFSDAGTVEP